MSAENSTTRLEFRNDEFTILVDGAPTATIEWSQVREIVAYRRDPDEKDLLCLGFRVTVTDDYIEVDEEVDGYQTLLEKMYEAFPSLKQKWWQGVTSSYGINWTTIYEFFSASRAMAHEVHYALRDECMDEMTSMSELAVTSIAVEASVSLNRMIEEGRRKGLGGWDIMEAVAEVFNARTKCDIRIMRDDRRGVFVPMIIGGRFADDLVAETFFRVTMLIYIWTWENGIPLGSPLTVNPDLFPDEIQRRVASLSGRTLA